MLYSLALALLVTASNQTASIPHYKIPAITEVRTPEEYDFVLPMELVEKVGPEKMLEVMFKGIAAKISKTERIYNDFIFEKIVFAMDEEKAKVIVQVKGEKIVSATPQYVLDRDKYAMVNNLRNATTLLRERSATQHLRVEVYGILLTRTDISFGYNEAEALPTTGAP